MPNFSGQYYKTLQFTRKKTAITKSDWNFNITLKTTKEPPNSKFTAQYSPEMTTDRQQYSGEFQNLTSNLDLQSEMHAPTYQNTKPKTRLEPKIMKTTMQHLKQKP